MSEFDLINRFFNSLPNQRPDVVLGIGDDCAILDLPEGKQLAMSTDTLVAGVHFPEQTAAEDIGYKSLAVNLSDLAAMGAEPAWVSLALTLPASDSDWLESFSSGFLSLSKQYAIQLIGGDTTRGSLTISVTAHGFVEAGRALRRDGARPGDRIYVSGTLGDAALALRMRRGEYNSSRDESDLLQRLERPSPRITLGRGLVGTAAFVGKGVDLGTVVVGDGLRQPVGVRVAVAPLGDAVDQILAQGLVTIKVVLEGFDDLLHREPRSACGPSLKDSLPDRQQRVRRVGQACAHAAHGVIVAAALSDIPASGQAVVHGSRDQGGGVDPRPLPLVGADSAR